MSEKDIVFAALSQATEQELNDYKEWLHIPVEVATTPFFAALNWAAWVKLDKYGSYLREMAHNAEKDREPLEEEPCYAPQKPQTTKRRASSEVIEISSDDEEPTPQPPKKKRVHKVKEEPQTEPLSVPTPGPVKLTKSLTKNGRIMISQRESVEKVVQLKGIPERMPVPDVDTAYIIDFSGSDSKIVLGKTYTGKSKNLDRLLKAEDQDSWGNGTNGSTSRPTNLTILNDLPSRRSTHYCKGGLKCEFFDPDLLEGYERNDAEDMELTKELYSRELEQNKNDSLTSIAVTASFFRHVEKRSQCSLEGCPGTPILKRRTNGPSDNGKDMFIGCSRWQKSQEYRHTYFAIPSSVDETVLGRYMAGEPVVDADSEDEQPCCSRLMHPRHGKQTKCPHSHFQDGKLVVGAMVSHTCPVKKIVYTSQNPDIKTMVVIFRGRHSHPPWPAEKPTLEARADVDKCLTSMGTVGTTGGKLNNSATTRALLGSNLAVKHPAFRNKRKLRDVVLSRKDASTPAGLLWAGILDQYEEDLDLPVDEQYIRIVRMEGELKLAITLDSALAKLIHEVQYAVPDFTFKRVKGSLNEWEVTVWLDGDKERVSIARIYCNKATAEAFYYIFDGFFMAIKQVTGRPVRFKAFEPEGNIISLNFDMEAAQIQGLGLALIKLLGDKAPTRDPDMIVRYVVKLCSVHWTRSTDPLVGAVGQATVDYLNRFRGLKTAEDIAAWHEFCKEHPNKKLRDWYQHKISYSWLLPCYNEYLSLFPPGFWDCTPHHTNLVESAHAGTNQQTGTRLFSLEAIQMARVADAAQAASIAAARETCIPTDHNNHDQSRFRRAAGRQSQKHQRRLQHASAEDDLAHAVQHLQDVSDAKKEASARVKVLREEKRGLGRAPRNINVGDKDGNAVLIPRVSSSTVPIPIEDDVESDIEMVDDGMSEPGSYLSRAPTPPRSGASDFDDSDGFGSALTSDYESSDFGGFGTGLGYDSSEAEWDQGDDEEHPHVGHYLLGAPGFNLQAFLDDCDVPLDHFQ
ncbi:hypothetical protein DFH07DRAFT_1055048 [Mycena maculata]|uniref:Uncharacterized protein n=1 Tax=Mycena maculata TaxID=230809 RepID=A0AAD7KEJ1_9AGAR|nr:hypothetical protein DFH07DRAFT_1055048 [Mycena maculata]